MVLFDSRGTGIIRRAMPRRITAARLLDLDARRICLIKPSALGDVAQTLPLLSVLRRRFPGATIDWVINRELAELLAGHPDLHEVIAFDRHGSWRDGVGLLQTLRRRRFDLVFDLQGLLRTGVMTFATGAPFRVGLQTAREGANLACHWLLPDTGRYVPAYARYWRVAEALGMGDLPRQARIALTEADRSWVFDKLRDLPRPILAIHPGARWVTKRWPVEKFAEVAAQAADSLVGSIVVVGSASELPLAARIVETVRHQGGVAVSTAGETTLKQLAALSASADLLLSNDSGPMHLAAELGTPVVGLFTCTSPYLSGPQGSQHQLVATKVKCAAGYHKGCPHRGPAHLACLHELSVERVRDALARTLTSRPAARSA